MGFIKRNIKAILRNLFGLEVRLAGHDAPPAARQVVSSLREFEIDLVLDVGANKGQFASEIRQCGYTGEIVSFEPLSSAHGELVLASTGDPKWKAYTRCALGDHDGEVEINIAGNSYSSSILPMLESHSRVAPGSTYQGKEVAPLRTIDAVAEEYLKQASMPFLKIDTQGFEWQVLEGAKKSLPKIRGVLVELSLIQLYEGQRLWRDVIDRLEAEGFTLWAFLPEFTDPDSGRTLQVNGVFYRTR
jgi:FkbM family methyltransferase